MNTVTTVTKLVKVQKNPLGRVPSDEFVRDSTHKISNWKEPNRYTLLISLIRDLWTFHGIDMSDKADMENYAYEYYVLSHYNYKKNSRYHLVAFRGRDKNGKKCQKGISNQAFRDLIWLERAVDKEEIYPNHFPLKCLWSDRWRGRRKVTEKSMHLTYVGGKIRKKLHLNRQQKAQRIYYKRAALVMFPLLDPGEAYIRYAMYRFNKQTAPKREAFVKEMMNVK